MNEELTVLVADDEPELLQAVCQLIDWQALGFRLVGVLLCVAKTNLSRKERIYCVIAYLPKATVQAAIGSAPLAAGLPCGKLVLSVAVLAIVITAPLGAELMDVSAPRLLRQEKE